MPLVYFWGSVRLQGASPDSLFACIDALWRWVIYLTWVVYSTSVIRYGGSHQYSCRILRDISFPHSGQRLRTSDPFLPCQVVVRCLKYDFVHINFFFRLYLLRIAGVLFRRRAEISSENTV